MKFLRTSDLAKAVGVHPNTVRRYVDRGLLPPVEHSPSGYRRFTQRHLDCLRLARQVYCNQYPGGQMTAHITIRGARLHNLKNVTLTIPKNQLVVLTGVSGSRKSTLRFDILKKQGQRQYMEALGLVAFGLAKPPVHAITGPAPS